MTEKERGGGEDTYMCMIISAINMYVQHRYKQINFLVTLTHTPVLVYRIATMTAMIKRFFLYTCTQHLVKIRDLNTRISLQSHEHTNSY